MNGSIWRFEAHTISWLVCLTFLTFTFLTFTVRAAGIRELSIPADPSGPQMSAMLWTPCAATPGPIIVDSEAGPLTIQAVRDCVATGKRLPLIVISHGLFGDIFSHHDTAAFLADGGFAVVTLNHTLDSVAAIKQKSADDIASFLVRPVDIKRAVSFLSRKSEASADIDAQRIGFFGFSRGGYTGLVLAGAVPDFHAPPFPCPEEFRMCQQIRDNEIPDPGSGYEPRIKAFVIADPVSFFPDKSSLKNVTAPIQLWSSEHGGMGVRPEDVASVAKNLPVAPEFHRPAHSGHFSFLFPCSTDVAKAAPFLCTDPPGLDRADFHKKLNGQVLDFFHKNLSSGSGSVEEAGSRAEAGAPRAATIDDREIEKLVRFRIEKQYRATSAVIGVVRPSGRSIIAHRSKRGPHAVELGGDTIFEVASLTKIFTALLLADAATRGDLRLDDPLSAFVPKGVKVPDLSGRAITLADLATHTSGLPLRPNNLNAAPDAPNKYAGYTLDQLYAGLPEYRLEHAPGSQFEYSNLAFALLGHALAQQAGEPFPDLLRRRVTTPLGLSDTRFDDDPAAASRRAQGHDMDLKPIGPTSNGALSPAGGLRSTANDLLRLLDLFLNSAGPDDLARAARLMLTLDRPGEGEDTRMMLGWRRTIAHGETYYWSNGSSDGSRTFMGFNPARGVAVVALADAASGGGLDDIAWRVLDPLEPVDMKIVPRPRTVELPSAAIDRVLGTYRYAPGDEMTITRGVTGLIVTDGQGQFLVQPQSRTRFFAKGGGDLSLDFPGPASQPADRMVLRQNGKSFVYHRVQPDVTTHE